MSRSVTSYLIFAAVLSTVQALIHYYLWYRLVRSPDLDPVWQRRGKRTIVALGLVIPGYVLLALVVPPGVERVLAFIAYGWMGVAVILLFLLLPSEALRLAARAALFLRGQPMSLDRRTFLSRLIAGTAGVLGALLSIYGVDSALGQVRIRAVRVPLPKLPLGLAGFRIAQLTDLHIGPMLGHAWLEGIVAKVNELEPDLIAITGDLVDGSVDELRFDVAPLSVLRAKHGVYFVTGNHEYYSGADAWIAELERLGIRVLRNERVSVGEGDASFDLAGVDDWSSRRHLDTHGPDLAKALAGRDASKALVLLAHQPKQIAEAAERGVGLQISGHTHGGQIFPWGLAVGVDQPYVRGLSQHGDTQIFVSNGTGYWGPPMRVGSPPEIAVVELV